jgi:PST family polysaccharide transporter
VIVPLLFGHSYAASAPILAVHVWAAPFIFTGTLLGRWLINESMLGRNALRHGAGATANIGLNLLLIPMWGGIGAAWATLASYAVANYLFCFGSSAMRDQGRMITLAFLAPLRWGSDWVRGSLTRALLLAPRRPL